MCTDILKINCEVFYITSVKFIIRNVCTEHIYCLQDVLKKVCRVYCLQGVVKKRLQGVVKKIVCRVQKKSWAAGCRSAGCHVRLTVQTKRSSAGCILGLVMIKSMYLTQHTNRLTHLELAVSTAASSSSIRFYICLFSPCATANASRYLFVMYLCCCTLKCLCCKTFCSLRFSLCIFASLIFVSSACSFAFIT